MILKLLIRSMLNPFAKIVLILWLCQPRHINHHFVDAVLSNKSHKTISYLLLVFYFIIPKIQLNDWCSSHVLLSHCKCLYPYYTSRLCAISKTLSFEKLGDGKECKILTRYIFSDIINLEIKLIEFINEYNMTVPINH